jgi:outer membrane lipoprotein-sorting protein
MEIKRKLMRYGIAAMGLAICVGVLGVANTNAQGVLKEILDRMDGNYKSLSSFKSNVTLVKYNSQIEKSDTNVGTTSYLPKDKNPKRLMYVRIDWTKPLQESIVVIGDDYKMYRPALKQIIIGKTSKGGSKVPNNALAFLSMSKSQLQANYTVSYIGQETISGGTQTWHILMSPKIATSYKTAELWVDSDGMPRQAKITENNDDTSTILLTNIEKNIVINASAFTLVPPPGTAVVKG